MALQRAPLFASVPSVEVKKDPKQLTFEIPHCLIPRARQIFYKRYACDVSETPGYKVGWLDEAKDPVRNHQC